MTSDDDSSLAVAARTVEATLLNENTDKCCLLSVKKETQRGSGASNALDLSVRHGAVHKEKNVRTHAEQRNREQHDVFKLNRLCKN